MWAFVLRLWAYVLVGFCPRGFCPRGFCPRGFCPALIFIKFLYKCNLVASAECRTKAPRTKSPRTESPRTGYQVALIQELDKYRVSIAGITEARITGHGCCKVEDSMMFHPGGDHHLNGVALVLMKSFAKSLHSWQPISDRHLTTRLSHKHGHITVIVAYAPTELAEASDKVFYDQLSSLV